MLAQAPTILLIDDEAQLLFGLSAVMKRAGYTVLSANNGAGGINLAQTHHPDLIVCDVMMPPPDGFEVKTALSEKPDTAAIPFIFLTARTSQSDRLNGFKLKSDDYVTKPFDRDELLARVEAVLRRVEIGKQQVRTELDREMLAFRHEVTQNFSHEFRTPISIILSSLELMMEEKFSTDLPEEGNFLRMALESTHHLHGLLEDVILLAKKDQREGNIYRQPIDLKYHFTEPVYHKVQHQYGDKNLQLLLQVEEPWPLSAPLPEFVQAVRHLVDNACKFSPPHGKLEIKLAANGPDGAILTVTNEAGPVIPPELRGKVFERYYQVGQGRSRAYNGLGVGLTLARAMARSIGGDVLILDTDHGCMVQMTIPPSQADPSVQVEAYYEI